VVLRCGVHMAVVLLSVTVVLPCVALVVMLRSAVTITAARITVADGGRWGYGAGAVAAGVAVGAAAGAAATVPYYYNYSCYPPYYCPPPY